MDRISSEIIREITDEKTENNKLKRFRRIEREYQWESQVDKRNNNREKPRLAEGETNWQNISKRGSDEKQRRK